MDDDVPEYWLYPHELASRPILQSRMVDAGTVFDEFRVSFCVCAPSRGTLMSSQYWWDSLIAQEGTIGDFDYTKQLWRWHYGAPGDRHYQTFHWGKVLNGWGTNTWPVPPNMMVDSFDEFYGITFSFSSKGKYSQWRETFDEDGVSLGGARWDADYSGNQPATFDDYCADRAMIDATNFLDTCANRQIDDPRRDKPFFMTITPTLGHTPFQKAPVRTPDTLNRASRQAFYDAGWIPSIYDDRTSGAGLGTSGTATGVSATDMTDSSKNWTVDQWCRFTVRIGSRFGVVLSNTATTLTIGEWYVTGSANATNSFTAGSTPAAGAYTIISARPDIDLTDVHVQGTGGEYASGTGTGANIKDERNSGQDLVGVDDILETVCAKLEALGATNPQYSLDNTYIILMSDNGFMRGQKGIWEDKSYVWDVNFRVPCVIRGPGVAAGVVNHFPLTNLDIPTTVMGLTGVTADRTPAGIDLSAQLVGEADWADHGNRAYLINIHPRSSTQGVMTSENGRPKYRYFHDANPHVGAPVDMLHDLSVDPFCLRNLWNDGVHTAVQADLVALTAAYYNDTTPATPFAELAYP